MKLRNKVLCLCLASCILLQSGPVVLAGAPQVSVDESLYVNLDYYGETDQVSVVKGCNLNGNDSFTDYGHYQTVTNMSNYAQPIVDDESITWNLTEDTNRRFYYEGTLEKDEVELPWTFDISYKLDGVPIQAEKLAGASGLVEIKIKCIPNEKAAAYFQNNMLLQVATMINMEDTLSVEAPGSQTQTIGAYKAIVFAAVPGEEKEFVIRIGTESFETSGIVMLMIPGTLDQMKEIKEIKEIKDTVSDSADSIYSSLNDILTTLENLSGSMQMTQQGLQELQRARESVSNAKGELYQDADQAIDGLDDVSKKITDLIPHLQNGQQLVQDISNDLNSLTDTGNELGATLNTLKTTISAVQNDLSDVKEVLEDTGKGEKERRQALRNLENNLNNMSETLKDLESMLQKLENILKNGENAQSELEAVQKIMEELETYSQQLQGLPGMGETLNDLKNLFDQLTQIQGSVGNFSEQLLLMVEYTRKSVSELQNVCESGAILVGDLKDVLEYDDIDNLADDTDALIDNLKHLLTKCEEFTNEVNRANETLNQYQDGTIEMLGKSADLLQGIGDSITDLTSFLKNLKTTLQESGKNLDSGTEQTLNGLIDVLEKALDGESSTGELKDSNTEIKEAIDGKVDEYEDKTNLLELDADAEKVSFTSSKNPAPESLQIILRTQEITIEDLSNEVLDYETEKEDIGLWGRIVNVFQSIWNTIVSWF